MRDCTRGTMLMRICAIGIFVIAAIFMREFALQDFLLSSVDRTGVVVGYAPQYTTQFLAWDASYNPFLVAMILFASYGALLMVAVFLYRKAHRSRFLLLVLVTAMGLNLAERVAYGGVVDYIRIGALTMNLADTVIIGSACLLVIRHVLVYRRSER